MSRVCELTGVGVQSGNNVSHSQRKTRRRFLPNLQRVTLRSDKLEKDFKFRVTTRALRTIEVHGGLDNYLLASSITHLSKCAQYVRKQLKLNEV